MGFATGRYRLQSGHNIEPPYRSVFARSPDGGETWQFEDPEGFVGDPPGPEDRLPENADFTRGGFMMRVVGNGYHGSEASRGAFFLSEDRGHSWWGPFGFGPLADDPALQGMEFTPRTDYIVEGHGRCWCCCPPGRGLATTRCSAPGPSMGEPAFSLYRGWCPRLIPIAP